MNLGATFRKAQWLGPRATLQKAIDELQFQYDTFHRLNYQPLPWIDLNSAKRNAGTEERWQAIERALGEHTICPTSALDIGCNIGYFCFALALMGIPTLGVEMNDRYVRIARYAAKKIKSPMVAFCTMEVAIERTALLPNVDVVLLLSVWHHWVRRNGFESATELLSAVWGKCNQALFFETGEMGMTEAAEMSGNCGLSNAGLLSEEWLANYLMETCDRSVIVNLGQTKAFASGSDGISRTVPRYLYMVERKE